MYMFNLFICDYRICNKLTESSWRNHCCSSCSTYGLTLIDHVELTKELHSTYMYILWIWDTEAFYVQSQIIGVEMVRDRVCGSALH